MCGQFLRLKFAGFYPIFLRWCDFAEEEKLFATLDEFFLEGTAKLPVTSNRPIISLLWINNAIRGFSPQQFKYIRNLKYPLWIEGDGILRY